MKVTTEKLPKSTLSLVIELDKARLEQGLDQAARRLSKKYPVHGFRPGKAPRFIIERTYGRATLIEEASEDLINKAYREAIDQEKIVPIGQPSLEEITSAEPFAFRVTVPIAPTVNVGNYRAITASLDVDPLTDEQLERNMEMLRDKHVVLKELEEERPAQEGDQLKVHMVELVDGEPLDGDDEDDDEDDEDDEDEDEDEGDDEDEDDDEDDEDDEDDDEDDEDDDEDDEDDEDEDDEDDGDANNPRVRTLDLVNGRLVDDLYQALVGARIGDKLSVDAGMPDDHSNEKVRGKVVTFKVKVLDIKERLLPDWEELPTLEQFEGSLDDLRAKTRTELEKNLRESAERKTIDAYVEQLVAQTEYDIPDVMIHDLAHQMLEDQGRQFERYGITLEQMLQYRGKTHEQAIEEFLPDAEKQTKSTLALREVVRAEGLNISDDEIETELGRMLNDYSEEERPNVAQLLNTQLRSNVANMVLDRKLRERLIAIATGTAPAHAADAEPSPADSDSADPPASAAAPPPAE